LFQPNGIKVPLKFRICARERSLALFAHTSRSQTVDQFSQQSQIWELTRASDGNPPFSFAKFSEIVGITRFSHYFPIAMASDELERDRVLHHLA
jgi:hypothetical protein